MIIIEISDQVIELEPIKHRLAKQAEGYIKAMKLLDKKFPNYKEDIIKQAEEAFEGMLQFPGTGGKPIFVGNPPIWITGADFRWFLSRGDQWVDMLQAYAITDDEKYAKKVLDEFMDWDKNVLQKLNRNLLDKNNSFYAHGKHPLRLLEVGIHLYKTWPFILRYLGNSPLLTDEILETYMRSVHVQAAIIHKYSPLFWPKADHNHYLMENLGMLTTALMFPEFPESKEWKETGIRELNRASKVQLTDEGGQIEGSASYHNGAMFWFGLLPILANEYHFEVPNGYIERYKNSLNYCLHVIRPTGKLVPFGDSHSRYIAVGGMVYGYLVTGENYWLRHALQFYSKEQIIKKAAPIIRYSQKPEEFLNMLEELRPLQENELLPKNFINYTLGQAFVRTAWEKDALFFGISDRSPVQNGHAHIDNLTFEFVAYGKNIITDPGIYTYHEGADRRYYKSSLAHSTVVINNQDFFEYVTNFKFGPQKDGKLTNLIEETNYTAVIGFNNAYEPTTIQRVIMLVNQEFILIVDKLLNRNSQDLVTRTFHTNYQEVIEQEDAYLAIDDDEKVNALFVNYPAVSSEKKLGRISTDVDTEHPSIEIHYNDRSSTDFYTTVIYPVKAENRQPVISISVEDGIVQLIVNEKKYFIDARNLQELEVSTDV